MPFDDITFPEDLSYGSKGGPGFKTDVSSSDSGTLFRVARWPLPRYQYDVAYAVKDFEDLDTVKKFFIARQGSLRSFLFVDPLDNSTASDNRGGVTAFNNVTIGTGDGSTTKFQLYKSYGDAANTLNRTIRRPVSGTLEIGVNGVKQLSGWTLNTTDKPGEITFSVAPPNGQVVTWGGTYKVECIFDPSTDEWFSVSIDQFDDGSVDSIRLLEVIA